MSKDKDDGNNGHGNSGGDDSSNPGKGHAYGRLDPTVSVSGASTVAEGNSGNTALTYTFSLDAETNKDVTVTYEIVYGDGVTSSDLSVAAGTYTVTIPKWETSASISLNVVGDKTVEGNETFGVKIVSVTEAEIGLGEVFTVINNDDLVSGKTSLFTSKGDTIDYNNLGTKATTATKIVAEGNNNDGYHEALGGNDTVYLPKDQATADALSYSASIAFDAGDGNDKVVVGENLGATVYGGGGGDRIYGLNHADNTFYGDAGADDIAGGYGNDTLYGGADKDIISGWKSGWDTIYGEGGMDTLTASSSDGTVIYGGADADSIYAQYGVNVIYGDDGNDTMWSSDLSWNTWYGGAGDDTIKGNANADTVDGGAGSDYILTYGGDDVVFFAWEMGAQEIIDAGDGFDTLNISFATMDEFANGWLDLASLMTDGWIASASLGMTACGIEDVNVFVDGVEIDYDAWGLPA